MPETASKGPTAPPQDTAIAHIVQMNPRRVTVTLTFPVAGGAGRPTVTLEWSREDTTMPLSDLLQRIESYVSRFGNK